MSRSSWVGGGLAIVAALALWGVMQAKYPYYVVDAEKYGIGMSPPIEQLEALEEQNDIMARRNMMVTFAIGGGLLGIALAIAGTGCCSLPLRALAGIAWGALWGAGTGYVGVTLFSVLTPQNALASPMSTGICQGAVFSVLGAGLGLLYGGFTKSPTKCMTALIAGAAGGFGGAILYPILSSLVAASESTQEMVPPSSIVKLIWLTVPFAGIGFLIPTLTDQPLSRKS